MGEKKYEVLENKVVIATGMDIEIALLLIKSYASEYYCEKLNLTIREVNGNETY